MNRNDYWINFWKDYSKKAINKDVQSQVLRTIKKVPIDENSWNKILQFVFSHMNIDKEDNVLDLFWRNRAFC